MTGMTLTKPRRIFRMPRALGAMPPWRIVVLVVACTGTATVVGACISLGQTGFTRPWVALIGFVATAIVNRVYVVIARRGEVREGIDMAEAPIVALALLLPPGEALLAFIAGSAVMELPLDRAPVKKAFNIGIRATGAGLLTVPLLVVGSATDPGIKQYVAVGIGAFLYTAGNWLAVVTIVSSVEHLAVRSVITVGMVERLVVWTMSVSVGFAAAYVTDTEPRGMVGFAALVGGVSLTAAAAQRSQREGERLRRLLDANLRIQHAADPVDQEAILVDVAQELMVWRDVSIRDQAPLPDEAGVRLYLRDSRERWLIATPRPDADPWSAEDARILDALGGAATAAFERARLQAELERQARHDPLTGLANRRHFDEVAREVDAAGGRGLGIVLCDLDGFKSVNDRLGHEVGDELLELTARRLVGCVRETDLVARLGGDEFVILVPDVESAAAMAAISAKITERLAEHVHVGRWQLAGIPHSLGVATGPRDGDTVREVLRAADTAMYAAKRSAAGDHGVTVLPHARRATDIRVEHA